MRKLLFIAIACILSIPVIGQDSTAKPPLFIPSKLVSTLSLDGNTIFIYRRNSDKIPFYITATDAKSNHTEFYIIRRVSDIYSYLIIEKNEKEVLYYPLTWATLKDISIKDINERVKDILNGDVRAVDKNSL
jgi:hypothetical protein